MKREQPFFHEAMRKILLRQPKYTAHKTFLSKENRRLKLYRKRDGKWPTAHQIGTRLYKKQLWFEARGKGMIQYIGPKKGR